MASAFFPGFSPGLPPGLSQGETGPQQHRLLVFEPGHFHASLLQKEMYPELSPRVSVYGPLGPELLDYLRRVSLFNGRLEKPTGWELDIHTGHETLGAMLGNSAGSVVVFSGRNRGKIDRILSSLERGMHVLADKPWIISSSEMPKLEKALDLAQSHGVAAYDIMTERYEVTSQLGRELVNAPEIFGSMVRGDQAHPAIRARSVHHIMKVVAGVPLERPVWFFDVTDYGEGLADVGTHPVDLIQWTVLPDQSFDYLKEIQVLAGRHEAVKISRDQFKQVTGATDFPQTVAADVHDRALDFFCNNYVDYTLRGIHVKLDVLWAWEAAAGTGDVYEASFQGTRARVEVRQGAAEKFQPEVYVVPASAEVRERVFRALSETMQHLQSRWPGIAAVRTGDEASIAIPPQFRVGHEEHFGQVANHFLGYVQDPKSMPAWERSYMLAKYYVTTRGVEMSRGR